MSGSTGIDPGRFVASVTPLLEAKDPEGLRCHLTSRWSAEQIVSLLACENCDARNVAALALGLVGGECCVPALAERLRDPDPTTNQMAEHALWSIWFRCGTPVANSALAHGARCLSQRRFDCAISHFNRAIEQSPGFAEAYNQRAIAYYLMEDFEQSAADCRRAVELMPCHFGAWAGLGNCHAHLGRLEKALECYDRALQINPHLECIHQAVCTLRLQLGQAD